MGKVIENIIIFFQNADLGFLIAGSALIVSLYSLKYSRQSIKEDKELRVKQTKIEIDIKLDKAWDLLGGDIRMEAIPKFNGKGKLNTAKRIIRECTELDDSYAPCYRLWGLYFQGIKQLEKSKKAFKKTIELDPDYAVAHNNLGVLYVKLERNKEAEQTFKKAIELDLDYAHAHNNLGILYAKLERNPEAK